MKKSEKTTALYCRVALASESGMDAQKELLLQYAGEHGYTNLKIYADNGPEDLRGQRAKAV